MVKFQDKLYNCPLEVTSELIEGKWKLVILWNLRHGAKRFSDLKRMTVGVTQKMLTQQLRELEAGGLINRKVYAEVPPRVEYTLTELGRSLGPIIKMMCSWGIDYVNDPQYNSSLAEHEVIEHCAY